MLKSLLRDKVFLLLLALTIFIKILSRNEAWVEKYYTNFFYPIISQSLRFLFGWLPFSFGDLLYLGAIGYFIFKGIKFLRMLGGWKLKQYLSWVLFRKLLRLVLSVYLLFNILWGLNYNRLGLAAQLKLDVQPYSIQDLDSLHFILQERLNTYAVLVNPATRKALNRNRVLFNEGIATYQVLETSMPIFRYSYPSLKSSLFSHIGHYFGFTGYYNPFSGEGQIKTTVPIFLKPFVLTHEIGHQLGYAKENEANFAAFFACRSAPNPEFRYSLYFEMYQYAIRELYRRDSVKANIYRAQLHPQVKKDTREFIAYLITSKNVIEPWISIFYDEYLKLNNQPQGKMTYNEVVAWLIAYQKKFGLQSI